MEPGWQKYLEAMDNRIEKMESKMDDRFGHLDHKFDQILAFKWLLLGGGMAVSAVASIIFQVGKAVIEMRGGH